MTSLTAEESAVVAYLAPRQAEMIALLGELVSIDSPSRDKSGVDAVGATIERFLRAHSVGTSVLPNAEFGDCLRTEVGSTATSAPPILLLGHRDTVFPAGEAARRPFRVDGARAYGPGVADMKAGLVMNAFVLSAFQALGVGDCPLVGLFTADEEITSPSSSAIIEQASRMAVAVFNAEPGRVSGNVVTGRKGIAFLRLDVAGKAAHSGTNFTDGHSAISALARKISALDGLTDLARGVTLNVGLIGGGQSINTVAPHAHAEFELRYQTVADRDRVLARIHEIAADSVVGTSADVAITGAFAPFEQGAGSRALFDDYRACATDLGMTVDGEFAGGAADSGTAAAVGAPTLCGVGPIGALFHTDGEYIELASLVPRAQLLALAILRWSARGR